MYLNFWYPICLGEDLTREAPVRAELLGVRLVAFRDSNNAAHVLSDVCIHRGGSLGKGKVDGDCVVCPYHGWQFDSGGRCVNIPSVPDQKPPARAKIDSYPVHERYGIIFAFLGDLPEEERPPAPLVEEDGMEGWELSTPVVFEVGAYFERSVENGLDPIHNEFVHPAQGAPTVADNDIHVEENEWGSRFEIAFGGYTQADKRKKVAHTSDTDTAGLKAGSWHIGPNTLITGIYLPENNSFVQYFFEAPLSDRRTKIYFVPTRNNNLGAENNEWINATYMNVADEDIAIIEELWPVGTPDNLTKELLVPGDAAVVKYREYLKTWEKNGWRIDWPKMQQEQASVAFAIPSPARRESGNWILDAVPVHTG